MIRTPFIVSHNNIRPACRGPVPRSARPGPSPPSLRSVGGGILSETTFSANHADDYLNGGAWELVETFTEVESGKRSDRPELRKALEACRRHKATLVIAKLDRLSRNLAFIATLMDSGTDFVAVDNPHATRLTLHILAAVAEHEREMISQRTRAALAAAKARGKRLGNPRLSEASAVGRANHEAATARRDANVLPIIRELQSAGVTSLNAIAAELNRRGVKTARGGRWSHVQVGMVHRRSQGEG
jgi:DNA invertase Pin-like site-specific DNA recombinase